jgi:transposase
MGAGRAYLTLLPKVIGQSEHSLREVFNGLRYVIKTGAPWHWMPNGPPPWAAVYQQAQRCHPQQRHAALINGKRHPRRV